jgi:hypothetical protein
MSIDIDMDKHAYRMSQGRFISDVEILIPRLHKFLHMLEISADIEFDEWLAGEDFLSVDEMETLILQYMRGDR